MGVSIDKSDLGLRWHCIRLARAAEDRQGSTPGGFTSGSIASGWAIA